MLHIVGGISSLPDFLQLLQKLFLQEMEFPRADHGLNFPAAQNPFVGIGAFIDPQADIRIQSVQKPVEILCPDFLRILRTGKPVGQKEIEDFTGLASSPARHRREIFLQNPY
nr:hypothetical protein [uncultured Acetatifactor sp.]